MIPPENREEWVFDQARGRLGAERAAFLHGACAGDLALRERLEARLAAFEPQEALPATQAEAVRPTIKLDFADLPDESVGQQIGHYKILECIGEGGCGVVYVAEQSEPVRRRVALKVIKLGMDTRQVVARFEAERQALAMMDHPNIAKVLDAGTTETGRPYFVMELVRGIKITDYCDQAHCPTRERLDLFIKVCQAIQHAHQKGIIHRDIKPSNILVTLHDGVPVPKVIDFGIAKATEGRLTDATVYTQLHQFVGTPAYMSPEQAEMSGLAISEDGRLLAVGTGRNLIHLWNLSSGQKLGVLRGHVAGVLSLSFAPDGKTLASCGDNRVKLWNIGAMQEILTLARFKGQAGATLFSSDGSCLATSSAGDSVQLWRAPSFEEIAAAEAKDASAPGYGGQGKTER